ncbi:MAG: DUF2125 domain-containing protein [Hyphomonadaceae bacterium]|nr:DUF2125 domain-containing protein [Hyphomonadaceae bacterium]
MTSAYSKGHRPGLITILFALVVIACLAWSAYWFIARSVISQGIDDWIEEQRVLGFEVDYASRELSGFPFRFVLDLEDPSYGMPAAGAEWRADALQIVMQPWNYNHAIARAPGRHKVQLSARQDDSVQAVLGPRSAMSLRWDSVGIRQVSMALDEFSVQLAGDPAMEVDAFEFHLRPAPGVPEMLQLETHWQEVRLPGAPPDDMAFLGPVIGPSILRAELDQGVPAFAETGGDLIAVAVALRNGGELRVPQIMVEWGPAHLGGRLNLAAPDNQVAGSIGVRIEKADELRAALRADGQMTEELGIYIDALEAASANGGFLPLPIRNDGIYFLGNRVAEIPFDDYMALASES